MTDIVIPLGKGSRHADIELRYCLRSIAKHLTGVGRIIIVGERPGWLNWDSPYLIHVERADNPNGWQRAHNIYSKIMAAITCVPGLSDNFLFFNDDHFLLQDYRADEFPLYCRPGGMQLELFTKNPPQLRQMSNTVQYLHGIGKRVLYDFDIHCPILYNQQLFVEISNQLPVIWPEYGYGIKTLYGNQQLRFIAENKDDLKFKEPLMWQSIAVTLEGRGWFSVGDRCLKAGDMLKVLADFYPYKSKYEL